MEGSKLCFSSILLLISFISVKYLAKGILLHYNTSRVVPYFMCILRLLEVIILATLIYTHLEIFLEITNICLSYIVLVSLLLTSLLTEDTVDE